MQRVRPKKLAQYLENRLTEERDRLPLWLPVGVATGIALWFLLADFWLWAGLIAFTLGAGLLLWRFAEGRRLPVALAIFAISVAVGCAAIWLRTERVAAPVLERPVVERFYARIVEREDMSARMRARLVLDTEGRQGLPPRVRVNVPSEKASDALQPGAIILLRARLMPPAGAALPGAYDFARRAWYDGLGATGSVLGDVMVVTPASRPTWLADIRSRLSRHVQASMDGGAGAIGATLASGDRGAISKDDAEAMRRSGLAHLLSISGLHVTAIVALVYLLTLKSLALSPWLALRWRLPLVAAATAAVAAVGYTLLTGAQVPTIRACVAALLVLAGLALGREAITLRMVAAGALFVLLLWPETLFGPSFQLSFAAVIAIIALHEHPKVGALLSRREESWARKAGRFALGLFLTGLAVEIALMPIALFHFHKAGLYGALANIVAIPLTTFAIMPLLLLALLFDIVGAGGPVWLLAEAMLQALLGLAHRVSELPGAVTMLPSITFATFGLTVLGGLWLCLWSARWRWWGLVPMTVGAVLIVATPSPDILVLRDGRHAAIRDGQGRLAVLRNRTGDFAMSTLLENAGSDIEPGRWEDWPGARCSADACVATINAGERDWTLLATRSSYWIDALALSAACRRADIVISDRTLPNSCRPRWLKADRRFLRRNGGVAIYLDGQRIRTVRDTTGPHRWTGFRKD